MRKRRQSASDVAVERAEELGFTIPRRPEDEAPQVIERLEDITELSDQDLMYEFTRYIAWSNYANPMLAAAVTDEKALEKRLKEARSATYLEALPQSWEGVKSVTPVNAMAKAEQDVDEEVISIEDELQVATAYRRLLESLVDNLDSSASLISRELTRRVNQLPVERRGNRWGGS